MAYVVRANEIPVREGPTTDFPRTGGLLKNAVIEVLETQYINGQTWVRHEYGWSMAVTSTGQVYIEEFVEEKDTTVNTITENTPYETDFYGDLTNDTSTGSGFTYDIAMVDAASRNLAVEESDFLNINHVAGVFGLPYQFLPTADVRLDNSTTNNVHIGYEYAERIIEKIPLLFIAPGRANFMSSFSNKDKKSTLEYFISSTRVNDDNINNRLDSLMSSTGKYYTFEYDLVRYYEFVNPMCRIAARYLNLQDVELETEEGTERLDTMNWESYTRSGISSLEQIGTYTSIPFYVDADTSINESFSNSTSQSMIASTVNSVSDMAKELHFLLGAGSGALGMDKVMQDADITDNINNINDMVQNLLGRGNVFSNLANHLTTVASGGKLMFPEIWSDSSFSRDYQVKFKFIAPDPDDLSIYLNVLVPLFHLLGMVAPQAAKNNPNGYTNPFLVRAIYKGFFNVDMGIITSMSVTKGAECQWSPSGMPTSMEVSISIKDLYPVMSISSTSSMDLSIDNDTLSNTALMDYIANLCGINIYKPEVSRLIDMMFTNRVSNKLGDFGKRFWDGVDQKVQNLIMGIYR